jgi:hypothetical protein
MSKLSDDSINSYPWHAAFWSDWLLFADKPEIHPVFLLTGSYGASERALTMRMARHLLCHDSQPEGACGTCTACHLMSVGSHPDYIAIDPGDRVVITVDLVRDLVDRLAMGANQGHGQVVLLTDCHRMNASSVNALLKLIEEPPKGVSFFCITDHPKRCLATFTSRCRLMRLPRPNYEQAQALIKQQVDASISARQKGYVFELCSASIEQAAYILSTEGQALIGDILTWSGGKIDNVMHEKSIKKHGLELWLKLYMMTLYEMTLCAEGRRSFFFDHQSDGGFDVPALDVKRLARYQQLAMGVRRLLLAPVVWQDQDLFQYTVLPWFMPALMMQGPTFSNAEVA